LEDDREWFDCFIEAFTFSSGTGLRSLFVSLLLFGEIGGPLRLWLEYRQQMCDDIPHRLREQYVPFPETEDLHFDYGLHLLSRQLAESGKKFEDFQLPALTQVWALANDNPLITAQQQYDCDKEEQNCFDQQLQVNDGQRYCFNTITLSIDQVSSHRHFFLQGPAGTGKTFLYKCLASYYRANGKIMLCVASFVIAALLLPGGRTSHSQFRIPLELSDTSICTISKGTHLSELLQKTDLIIWDEVPMQHCLCFEAVDRMLQDICNNSYLFGGIAVVLGGDFAQILPVVRRGNRAVIVNACIRQSYIWSSLKLLSLSQNMRVQMGEMNERFASWLRHLSYDPSLRKRIALPNDIVQHDDVVTFCHHINLQQLLIRGQQDSSAFAGRAILAVRNDTAQELNKDVLDQMPGSSQIFYSIDSADVNDDVTGTHSLPIEYLHNQNPPSLPPAKLELRIGVPVILLRNLHPRDGLCNGTRLTISRMGRRCLEGKIMSGEFDGQVRLLPRIKLSSTLGELPFTLTRKQFSIRLCFAMTINKLQGQSFTQVGVDLRVSPLTHGQLYVSLSQVTDVSQLSVLFEKEKE
jgi:hypothetical protein